jgi:hypothetical protein
VETFRDQKTHLIFPRKVGAWTRRDITTYPSATAGYSVVYEIRGWLGGVKAAVSVDVYDKGLLHIPPGPNSPFVAIELQNVMSTFFANVLPVDPAKLDAYLDGTEDATRSLIGETDPSGYFRFAGSEGRLAGRRLHVVVFLRGHHNHFVKVQVMDPSMGKLGSELVAFVGQLIQQIANSPPEPVGAGGQLCS